MNSWGVSLDNRNPAGKSSNVFDTNGNLASRTDAHGITTTFKYDALNRLVREDYPGWTSTVFEYDDGNAGGTVNHDMNGG